MSVNGMDRAVGDIVIDNKGNVSLLVSLDLVKNYEPCDLGVTLLPSAGHQIYIYHARRIGSAQELLNPAARKFDLKTPAEIPDTELSEFDKMKRDNARLAERLARLESKQ